MPIRVMVADDVKTSRLLLETLLRRWGYDVVSVANGAEAWEIFQGENPPRLAILDWMMPMMNGLELCQRIRGSVSTGYTYMILLTSKTKREEVIQGLDAGADDYVVKPFDGDELRSRLRTGERIINLETTLALKVRELEEAMANVQALQGILPICMFCGRIRDEKQIWHLAEEYIKKFANRGAFSHGLCDECLEKHYPEGEDNPSNGKQK